MLHRIAACDPRTLARKKTLSRRVVARAVGSKAIRPDDIFVTVLRVSSGNRSRGLGEAPFTPIDDGGEAGAGAGDITIMREAIFLDHLEMNQ